MNEVIQDNDSRMVKSFGVTESGQLLVTVHGATFSKDHADVLYVYETPKARELFEGMKAAASRGSFYIKTILPLKLNFTRVDLPKSFDGK